ncbi:MAG: radical SAM protein [Clostridiales bacterium]|nr:radical SAM protein [Clostridiales bacterium]
MSARVALLRPRARDALEFQEPLGLESLAGQLAREGIACEIFDRELDRRLGRDTLDAVRAYGPTHVGITLMCLSEVADAQRLLVKLSDTGAELIMGGLLVTTATARCEALFPRRVTLVRGEGETVLPRVVRGETRARVLLDEAPLAPGDWPQPLRPRLESYLSLGGVICLRASRGCAGACLFCATPGLPPPYGIRAERPIPAVADEMALLARRARAGGFLPVFQFVDDDFGTVERAEALCANLNRLGVRAAFSLELRGATLAAATDQATRFAGLKAGGLCRVFLGLENLDPATLRRWGKPLDPPAVLRAVARLGEAGILAHVGYILWHPEITLPALREQVRVLHANGLFSPKAALSRLMLYPGSRLCPAGVTGPLPAPLPRACEAAWERVSAAITPLMEAWTPLAARLPDAACRAHLTGEGADLAALSGQLQALNNQACEVTLRCL